MTIPALIFLFFTLKQKSEIDTIFTKKMVKKLTFNKNRVTKNVRNILLFSSFFLIIIALARPVIEKGSINTKTKSIDIIVALDISKSMLADDIYPNRLEFAKSNIYEFIDRFQEANIGVIAFSSGGFLVSPKTQDSETLKYLIKNLSHQSITTKGTNISIPIKNAEKLLKESAQKILIIFTDGGDKESFEDEIKSANQIGLSVYIYATATKKGASIKDGTKVLKDRDKNIVITKLNENIKDLALKSGGAYIVGGFKDNSIQILIDDIRKNFHIQDVNSRTVKEYQELFYYPLALAIILLLFAFSSLPRRGGVATLVIIILSIQSQQLKADIFDFQTINKAHKAYKNGDYQNAVEYYSRVLLSKNTPQSRYDLANALYKNREYKEALKNYNLIRGEDKSLRYKKLFNIGNTLFALKRYKEALVSYEKAKEIKIESDLQHNIELTKNMLKDEFIDPKESRKKESGKKRELDHKDKTDSQKNSRDKTAEKEDRKKDKNSKHPKDKKDEKISEKEARKWEEKLKNSKPKTLPLKLEDKDIKREEDEKPW